MFLYVIFLKEKARFNVIKYQPSFFYSCHVLKHLTPLAKSVLVYTWELKIHIQGLSSYINGAKSNNILVRNGSKS